MAFDTKPRVLFSNPPWWVTAEPCVLADTESSLRHAGVRAGSRWPFTYTGGSAPGRRDLRDYVPYPFFLGYAASYVARATGANVRLRDSIATRETYDSYFLYLLQNRFDVIFIESASPSWDHDRALIARIRAMLPETLIVVTGPIATLGEQVLRDSGAAAAIKGEYEKGAVRVVAGARGVLDFDLLTVDEMNAAPFPYLDQVIWDKYWDANPRGQQFPQLQAWSSRGCPYRCIFCVWPAAMTGNDPDGTGKRSVRHYTPEYMRGFLAAAPGLYPYRSIYFDDDTFNLGDRHVLGMCEVMRERALPWSAMCRADTIRRETWKEMRDSGCFGVKIGFESGNQHVVDTIVNKRLDLAEAKETVVYLHSLGMSVHGTFTYGLPGETREQMQDTKRFIQELTAAGMDTYQESGCAEIEGAPLRTLSERGTLVAFPGARADAAYTPNANGADKLNVLARQFGGEYHGNDIDGWMEPEELQWLFQTAKRMRSIVEIGSFKGRSTHALCSGCPGVVTAVDTFVGPEIVGYDSPAHRDEAARGLIEGIFRENMKGFPNLRVIKGASVEVARQFADRSVDVVFIDACHTYESVVADIRAWLPKARVLISGHDYCAGWPSVMQAVNDELGGLVEVHGSIWSKRVADLTAIAETKGGEYVSQVR